MRGKHLRALGFKEPKYERVNVTWSLFNGELGRIRAVIMGPDEYIYLCTSNRDGRGVPNENDDIIARLTPAQ